MSGTDIFNTHDRTLEPFLYARVGEDSRGTVVTVFSALARLNLDPWAEAGKLAALRGDAARLKVGQMLSACKDIPALATEAAEVAGRLTQLLPNHSTVASPDGLTRPQIPKLSVGTVLIAAVATIILIQVIIAGPWGGSGE